MGCIEAIFYQVKVTDNQRSFLRYLWWNNNDSNGELVDYEMVVHVFGGTSSPGCYNYALRRTETAPDKTVKVWQMWCNTLQSLDTYEVPRCYESCGFEKVKEFWIHHFSDVSQEGYGQVSFIWSYTL